MREEQLMKHPSMATTFGAFLTKLLCPVSLVRHHPNRYGLSSPEPEWHIRFAAALPPHLSNMPLRKRLRQQVLMLASWRNPRTSDTRCSFCLYGRFRNLYLFALRLRFHRIFVRSCLTSLRSFRNFTFFHCVSFVFSSGGTIAIDGSFISWGPRLSLMQHPIRQPIPCLLIMKKQNMIIAIMMMGNIHQSPYPNPTHGNI